MLSDPDQEVASAFGVKRPLRLPPRRATFVIDTDRTVIAVVTSETNMSAHADRALATLRQRAAGD